jgi:hypothetical protein
LLLAMEKTLETPLREGDLTVAVLIEAPGPLAPGPAQATQFCQPAMRWICVFTVCADERREAAVRMNRAITRTDKPLVLFFAITTFLSPGVCFLPPQVFPFFQRRS